MKNEINPTYGHQLQQQAIYLEAFERNLGVDEGWKATPIIIAAVVVGMTILSMVAYTIF